MKYSNRERDKITMKKLSLMQKITQIKHTFNLTTINDPMLSQKLPKIMQLGPQIYSSEEEKLLLQVLVQTIQTQKTLSTITLSNFLYNTVFKTTNLKLRIPFTINLSSDNGQTFTQDYMDFSVRKHLVQPLDEKELFFFLNDKNTLNTIKHRVSTEPIKTFLKQKSPNQSEEFDHIKQLQFNTLDDQMFDDEKTNQMTLKNNHITFTAHLTLVLTQFEQQNNMQNKYYNDIVNNLHGYPLTIGWTTPTHQRVELYL